MVHSWLRIAAALTLSAGQPATAQAPPLPAADAAFPPLIRVAQDGLQVQDRIQFETPVIVTSPIAGNEGLSTSWMTPGIRLTGTTAVSRGHTLYVINPDLAEPLRVRITCYESDWRNASGSSFAAFQSEVIEIKPMAVDFRHLSDFLNERRDPANAWIWCRLSSTKPFLAYGRAQSRGTEFTPIEHVDYYPLAGP